MEGQEGQFVQQQVPLETPPPEPSQQPKQDRGSKRVSFSGLEAIHTVRSGTSRSFRIHVIVAIIISLASFGLWVFISFFKSHWPWFFYVANICILTTSFHYYFFIRRKELLPLHFVWFGSINLMILLSWFFSQNWGKAWFLYPLLVWGLILTIHYLYHFYHGHPEFGIYVHISVYCFVNALAFFSWLGCGCFPYFIYTFSVLALPLIVHWCLFYNRGDRHKLHLLIFIDVQLLLFFTWVVVGMGFPWFFFSLLVWGILLFIHFWKFPRAQPPPSVSVTDAETGYPPSETNPGQVPLEEDRHELYPNLQQHQEEGTQ